MHNRTWDIYTLIDPFSNQVRYVGITFRKKARMREHISRAKTGGKTYRDCWIRSLLRKGCHPLYHVVATGQGEGWQEAERQWIAFYRPLAQLTNLTEGGEGMPGYVPTIALRQLWSSQRKEVSYAPGRKSAMLGRHHTVEAKVKISAASAARKASVATRKAMSIAAKTRLQSLQGQEQIRIASRNAADSRRGKSLSQARIAILIANTTTRKPVICVETETIYPSITATAKAMGVTEASIYQALRKQCPCKGLHFKRLD